MGAKGGGERDATTSYVHVLIVFDKGKTGERRRVWSKVGEGVYGGS